MKKLLPLLCITCVFLSGCFQEKTYHDNGNLMSIGSRKDGKREGEWKDYDYGGKLERIGSFKDGNGEWKTYHKNGKMERIGTYDYDEKEVKWKNYHDNRELAEIGNYMSIPTARP